MLEPLAPTDELQSASETNVARAQQSILLDYRAWLISALSRRFGEDEAADLAQETYARLSDYEANADIRSPKSFLTRVALNLAANRFRKTRRETLTEPGASIFDERPAWDDQEQAVFFQQMLLALPPKLRDVFVLSHVKGLTYREIAQLRGISVKAVEKRMTQAIARCADLLRR